MSNSTFKIPDTDPPVTVTLPPPPPSSSAPELKRDQLLSFPAFKTWLATLRHSLSLQHSNAKHPFYRAPYKLRGIEVQTADFFGGGKKLGFVKLKAEVKNEKNEALPGSVFLRGGSVGMLIILQPDDINPSTKEADNDSNAYIILTVQPRIPAGSLSFTELPAGMLDEENPTTDSSDRDSSEQQKQTTFSGTAAREIAEETGLTVTSEQLINMTELALMNPSQSSTSTSASTSTTENLQQATYPSPGGSDEYIPLFLHRRRVTRQQLKEWEGRLTGLRAEGEKITVRIVPLREAWRVGVRDGKVLAALGLYWGLRGEGLI